MVKQKFGCIYRLTNTKNGRKYIGKTICYDKRMANHKNSHKKYVKSKTYLSHAIGKYGWNAFKQEIIIDNVTEEDLNNLEISIRFLRVLFVSKVFVVVTFFFVILITYHSLCLWHVISV